jgi:hypothetical protein
MPPLKPSSNFKCKLFFFGFVPVYGSVVMPFELIGQLGTLVAIASSHELVMSMSSKWATHIQGASSFGPRPATFTPNVFNSQTYNSTTFTPSAFYFGTVGGEILVIALVTNPQRKKKECDTHWVFKDE